MSLRSVKFTISEKNKGILEGLRSKLETLNEILLYYVLDIRDEISSEDIEIGKIATENKIEYRKKLEELLICILKHEKYTQCIEVYEDVKKNKLSLLERSNICINILSK